MKFVQDFDIIPLGQVTQYVYDLEVEDNHNFFANSILVHNSNYVSMHNIVKKFMPNEKDPQKIADFLDKLSKQKIEPEIEKIIHNALEYLKVKQNHISMKRENICQKALWTGKKRYCMAVIDSEGERYKAPKLKYKGIEIVKSSTPFVCQEKLKEAVNLVMFGEEEDLQQLVKDFRKEFNKLPAHQVAFPKSVNDLVKYQNATKSVPIQVRAALNYNKMLKLKNLENRYESIKNGNKIKYTYLYMPNTLFDDVIGFPEKLPEEFGLDEYINYDNQFQVNFLNPLSSITDTVKWKLTDSETLF